MSNLGPPFEDDEDYSPARMNAKAIHRDTGTALVALANTKQLGLVCPTDTSAGLIKNVVYYVDYDSSFLRVQFLPVFHKHTHDSSVNTDEEGGRYLDIRTKIGNLTEFAEWVFNNPSVNPSNYWTYTSTNGTISVNTATVNYFHRIDTLATTNNFGNAVASGPCAGFDCGDIVTMQIIGGNLNRNSNILVRMGLGVDRVQDAPSTSRRMMGLEGCDGHGTNWVMINANGNTSSLNVTATTMPLLSSAEKNYLLFHTPGSTLDLYYSGVLNASSNTNIASTGNFDQNKLFNWGVKLPAGTANITLDLLYARIIGNPVVNP